MRETQKTGANNSVKSMFSDTSRGCRPLKSVRAAFFITFLTAFLTAILPQMTKTVYADPTSYGIWVGGVEVTDENTSGEGWEYDATAGTLTLTNATLSGTHSGSIIDCGDVDLTIIINGENTLGGSNVAAGIHGTGSLIINGSGSLNIDAYIPIYYEYFSGNNSYITIDGPSHIELNVTHERGQGISADKDIIIKNCNLVIKGNYMGTWGITTGLGDISIDGCTVEIETVDPNIVTPTASDSCAAIVCSDGSFTIKDSTVSINSSFFSIWYGNNKTLAIQNSTVVANGAKYINIGGIYADQGSGSVTVDGTSILQSNTPVSADGIQEITFDANGGTGTMDPQYVTSGVQSKLVANTFEYDNRAFEGWNTDPYGDGDAYADVGTITITADQTLYAQWEAQAVRNTQLGAGPLANGAKVYYGSKTDAIGWKIIGFKGTGVASGSENATLISSGTLGTTKFSDSDANYEDSLLHTAINNILSDRFTSEEQSPQVMDARDLEGKSDRDTAYDSGDSNYILGINLTGQKLWPLSTAEAKTLYTNFPGTVKTGSYWWLRSPGLDDSRAAYVEDDGDVYYEGDDIFNNEFGVRPAINLNLSSIILTSAAENGKDAGAALGTLKEIADYSGNEWKLTILDSSRNGFTASAGDGATLSVREGYDSWTVPVTYSGASSGTDEHVSAILANSEGVALYYGHIDHEVTIPTGLEAGTYNLNVFSEQCNGPKKTDLSSPISTITLEVKKAYDLVYDKNGGSGEMTPTKVSVGDTYKFPQCSFTPPTNKIFDHWEMTGVDGWNNPDDQVVIVDNNVLNGKVTVTAHWKDGEQVATPKFTPAGGKYTGTQSVEISSETEGATIHYTTDGNPPTASSPTYKSAIAVSETMTIRAIAVKDGMADSDVATAKYTIEEPPVEYWTVSFDPNANDASGKMDPQQIEKGKTDNLKTNKYTREGFTFDSWNTKKDGSGTKYADKASFKPKGDTTLYAQWTEDKPIPPVVEDYTVTVTADPANGGTVKSSVASGKSGTKVTITAAAGKDFLFKEWKVIAGGVELADSKQPETTFSIKNADVEVQAIFEVKEADTYSVTATTDGHGSATASPTSGKAGTKVTLKAVSNAGYKFKKWKVVSGGIELTDATKAKTTFKIKNANVKVKAIFEKIYEAPQPEIEPKGEDKIILAWFKVNEAKGYDIFMSRCDHDGKEITPKLVKTIKNKNTTKWTVTGLKPNKSYKAIIKAYTKDKNGKKKYISKSPLMHVYTAGGNKSYTNAKSVKLDKSDGKIKKGNKLTLKVKDIYNIKASVKKADKSRELMPDSHVKTLRYRSSDPGVASVGASGKITAKKPGKCKIYVYAHNGVNKTINVTVK